MSSPRCGTSKPGTPAKENTMHRRNILATALAAAGALLAAGARKAQAQTKPETKPETNAEARDGGKAVYHVADLDKVGFALGNIDNHLAGVGGPEKATIELVIHGPALRAFHAATASPDTARRLASLVKAQVKPSACIHTMKGQNVTLKDLLPGFAIAERGGVVLIAQLQAQGYAYLRP
jgi:intracellular sulfur oxidation DsrE/DsrF family protein